MIRSMTGFGRGQDILDGMSISVEIKSVNHRYFDFSCRVPRSYGFLEEKLKTYIQTLVARGKIECYVSIEALEIDECIVNVNHSLAAGYIEALKEISERYNLPDDIKKKMSMEQFVNSFGQEQFDELINAKVQEILAKKEVKQKEE